MRELVLPVIRDSYADVVAPRDVEAITGVILKRYRQYAEGCLPTRLIASGLYSRRDQARLLFDAIDGCIERAPQRAPSDRGYAPPDGQFFAVARGHAAEPVSCR